MSTPSDKCPWSKQQIRTARRIHLKPLLERKGMTFHETGGDNYRVREYPGLVIRYHYWHWFDYDKKGNTIDFFTMVLGLTFADAMREIEALSH